MKISIKKHENIIIWLAFIVIAVAALFFCNRSAGNITSKKTAERQYFLTVKQSDDDIRFLVCHELPTNHNYDFDLSDELQRFKQILQISSKLDTNNTVNCVSYPIGWMEPSSRYPALPPKKQGEKRVAFVGDSTTFGEGVRLGDAFPEQINRYLKLYGNPGQWTSLNYGLMNFDLAEIYDYAFKEALKSKPDLIVYVWSANDVFKGTQSLPETANFNNIKGMPPLLKLVQKYFLQKETSREYVQWLKEVNSPNNPERIQKLSELMGRMKEEAREAGADFKVALFPIVLSESQRYPLRRENNFIAGIIRKENIPVYDLTDSILTLPAKQLQVHTTSRGPNFSAYRLAAKSLIDLLSIPTEMHLSAGAGRESRIPAGAAPMPDYMAYENNMFSLAVFFLLTILFFIFIITLALNSKEIWRGLWSDKPAVCLAFLLLIALALVLRIVLAPKVHLILNDEILRLRIIHMWMTGKYDANTFDNFPGVLMYYFTFFRIFGISPAVSHIAALTAELLSLVLLYSTVRRIFKNDAIALLSALVFSVFPVSIRFSLAQAAENPNLLFQTAAFFAVVTNAQKRNLSSFVLMLASCAILIFTRIYNAAFIVLILGFRAFLSLNYDAALTTIESKAKRTTSLIKEITKRLMQPRNVVAVVFMAAVTICFLLFFYNTVTTTPQTRLLQSPNHTYDNLVKNSFFMVKNNAMPIALTLLMLVGFASYAIRPLRVQNKRRFVLFFAAWFLVYFICHLASSAGSYDIEFNYDSIRYTLDFAVPLCVLASLGIYAIFILLPKKTGRIFLCFAVLLLLATPLLYSLAITYDTVPTSILKTLPGEIENYPPDTVFYTNQYAIYGSLYYDYGATVRYVRDPVSERPECGSAETCVLILFSDVNSNLGRQPAEVFEKCYSKYQFFNKFLAFCPMETINGFKDNGSPQ
jgi:hypothetical protein